MANSGHDILDRLLSERKLSPSEAEQAWMHVPGVYAIFADTLEALPATYRDELQSRDTNLIYIGKAEKP